jgi:hypothetical protein
MGTGGKIKGDGNTSTDQKLKAIEKLVKHGPRGSEWQEAGILHAIEKILDGHGVSSDDLKKLMDEARDN